MDQTFAGVIIIMTNRSLLVCFVLQTQQQNSNFENLRLQITQRNLPTLVRRVSVKLFIYLYPVILKKQIKEKSLA